MDEATTAADPSAQAGSDPATQQMSAPAPSPVDADPMPPGEFHALLKRTELALDACPPGVAGLARFDKPDEAGLPIPDGVYCAEDSRWQFHIVGGWPEMAVRDDMTAFWAHDWIVVYAQKNDANSPA